MRFIFLTVPAYGHLNPILGIVRELVRLRHKAVVYNTQEFAEKIKKTGAEFRVVPFHFNKVDLRLLNNAANMAETSLYITRLAVPALAEILQKEKFDCLIHDSFSLWGKLISRKIRIPTVSLVTSMAINTKVMLSNLKYLLPDYLQFLRQPKRMIKLVRDYRLFYKQIGMDPPLIHDIFINEEKLNIVFTSKYFQPFGNSFNSNYKFVGPIIYDRGEEIIDSNRLGKNKPIVYVALGTVYNDCLETYKTIIDTFVNTPYRVYVSIGSYLKPSDFGKIPDNFVIKNYLPQLSLLKKAQLFISHGGMNSINESLFFGVPLLIIPFIQEQRINAARVEKLGAGIYYKRKQINREELTNMVDKVLTTESYKKNAEKIRTALVQAGGIRATIKYILNIMN
ncbi:hypothetical protein HY612_05055 [Candidatus Roizmanbacteria bacterium]|nr:hypothetical protein [Candidatus Roizmanbacteria bacterium]